LNFHGSEKNPREEEKEEEERGVGFYFS